MAGPFDNWGFTQTVQIQRQGVQGTDEYGDDVYWIISTEDVEAILVPLLLKRPPRATRPGGFGEDLDQQYTVATGYTAFFPAETVLLVTDKVLINGMAWSVNGDPGLLTSPFTGMAMMQVELDRITG